MPGDFLMIFYKQIPSVKINMKHIIIVLFITVAFLSCLSQSGNNEDMKLAGKAPAGMAAAADYFLKTLSPQQKDKIQFDFDADERYNWHYIPKSRKGLPLKD